MTNIRCSVLCLLLTCWTAPASAPEATLLEPSVLRLSEAEIASMLGPEELYSGSEIAMWLVTDLLPEMRAEIAETSKASAAEAVKPLLVEIAGVRAELAETRKAAGGRLFLAMVLAALAGALVGAILAR